MDLFGREAESDAESDPRILVAVAQIDKRQRDHLGLRPGDLCLIYLLYIDESVGVTWHLLLKHDLVGTLRLAHTKAATGHVFHILP